MFKFVNFQISIPNLFIKIVNYFILFYFKLIYLNCNTNFTFEDMNPKLSVKLDRPREVIKDYAQATNRRSLTVETHKEPISRHT